MHKKRKISPNFLATKFSANFISRFLYQSKRTVTIVVAKVEGKTDITIIGIYRPSLVNKSVGSDALAAKTSFVYLQVF